MTDDVDAADQHAGDAPSRFSRTAFATRIAVGVAGCVALTGLAFAVDHANRPSRSFELTGQVSVTGAAAPVQDDITQAKAAATPAPTPSRRNTPRKI